MDAFTQKAREATKKNNRIVALSALKSRKLAESALQRRVDALAQIEEVFRGVEQAASDVEIIKALEGGATALETLNKDTGGIDRVEKVMDRVKDGIEEADDIGRVIAEMGRASVDDADVEEEFDEMLKAEEESQRKRQELLEKDRLREEAEKKQDTLVEDLKSVSLESLELPKDKITATSTPQTEEPIPN